MKGVSEDMYIISLADAAELKRLAEEKFSVKLHFHDGCGGQYFSLEEAAEAGLKSWIAEYADGKGLTVEFEEDGKGFIIRK